MARQQQLIEDLLAYAQVGGQPPAFAPVDCAALLDGVRMLLTADLAAAGAVLHYPGLPAVWGDAGQLSQLFQNLLANAVKFRQGERPLVVRVWAERQGEEWLMRVRDNGIGIPVPDAEKVFAIFQRLHGGGAYPGTGIGLALCKKIVERHGGRIWVESLPGQGATFLFTLPAVPSTARPASAAQAQS